LFHFAFIKGMVMRSYIRWSSVVIALLSLTFFQNARAWGPHGHALIAAIAEINLDDKAKAEALRLLKLEKHSHLDQVSSWPDSIRMARPETGPAHYVDIPLKSAAYSEKRDCHYDQDNKPVQGLTCVVAMLPHYVKILSDKKQPDQERLEALKWVVHLVGDIHQPLHAEDNGDRGGNGVHLTYYGHTTKLHAVWDGGVIEHQFSWVVERDFSINLDPVRAAAKEQNNHIAKQQQKAWLGDGAAINMAELAKWANASHALAQPAYSNLPTSPRPKGWEDAYQGYAWPVIEQQIRMAGVRLGGVLNRAIGSTPSP
jgi:hypothetical protein